MNLADIVILLALSVYAIVGFRKGLARSVTSVIGSIGGLIVGYLYARPLAAQADAWWGITTRLTNWLSGSVKAVVPAASNLAGDATPAMVRQALSAQNMPAPMQEFFITNVQETLRQMTNIGSLADVIARSIAGMLVTAVVFTLVYYLCRGLFALIGVWLTRLAEKSPLNVPNHFGGAIFGVLEGAIGLTLIVGVVTMIVALLPPTSAVAATCANSGLVKLFARAFYALVPATLIPRPGPR